MVGFVEKPAHPASDLANAGLYVFAPALLDEIPEPLPRDIGFDLLPRLVGRAAAVPLGDASSPTSAPPPRSSTPATTGRAGHRT